MFCRAHLCRGMDRSWLFLWAIIAVAVITSDALLTEASGHAEVAGPAASTPVKALDKSLRLQSAQGKQEEAQPAAKLGECKVKTTGDQPTASVTIDEKSLQAKFTCGGEFTGGTVPNSSEPTKCCKNATCDPASDQANISDVLGVEGRAENNSHVVTVTVAKVPEAKRGAKFYYKCTHASKEGEFCLVMVSLPGSLPSNECAIDRTVELSLPAPHTTAVFKCNGTLADKPVEVKTGDSCSGEPTKSAILTLTGGKNESHAYTLGVAELPDTTTKLCYECVYEDVPKLPNTTEKEKRTCSVMVTVTGRGTPSPEGSKTSTSTSSTSSASIAYKTLGVVASAVVALSAVVVD
ncbi:sag-related sequence protein srs59b [Cystoisospora suis]|uniref:Sag-related sequence protein srs59b n=1 Tax=Cystoisospora suis TaxID=483139 RepID=A0A2C6L885_9APIC|nr:sag-related sequence protein srs59b [Cystoisospora suis]